MYFLYSFVSCRSSKSKVYQDEVLCPALQISFILNNFQVKKQIYFTLYLCCTYSFQQQTHKKVKPWIFLHQSVFYCSLSESSLDNASAFGERSLSGALYWGWIPNQFFKALLKFLFSRPLPLYVQISRGTQWTLSRSVACAQISSNLCWVHGLDQQKGASISLYTSVSLVAIEASFCSLLIFFVVLRFCCYRWLANLNHHIVYILHRVDLIPCAKSLTPVPFRAWTVSKEYSM